MTKSELFQLQKNVEPFSAYDKDLDGSIAKMNK